MRYGEKRHSDKIWLIITHDHESSVHAFPFHSMSKGFASDVTGCGRLVFIGVFKDASMHDHRDDGVEVWEMVESGRFFELRQSIRWRERLPEDDCRVTMMDCTEEWLAVAFEDGLVTVWGWRAGEKVLELLIRLNDYHHPGR